MSHLFQRPLCDMGRAYDYAFRPIFGEPDPSLGGGCDEAPARYELWAAASAAKDASQYRTFELCPEHAAQLRRYDDRLVRDGRPARFRAGPA